MSREGRLEPVAASRSSRSSWRSFSASAERPASAVAQTVRLPATNDRSRLALSFTSHAANDSDQPEAAAASQRKPTSGAVTQGSVADQEGFFASRCFGAGIPPLKGVTIS